MPVLIPAIVAYAATSIAVSAGLVVAGSLAASAVGALAGLAASALVNKATADSSPGPQTALDTTGAGRTQQVRSPVAPHDVVVGRVRKSGIISFLHSQADDDGRADGYFYAVHIIASHHCHRLGDVYLDGVLSTDARFAGLARITKYLGTVDQVADAEFVAETGGQWTATDRWRGRAVMYSRYKGNAEAFPSGLPNPQVMVWGVDSIFDPRTSVTGWTNNPILIVYWWMTWGEGYAADEFDLERLIASANVCDERVRVKSSSVPFTVDAGTDYLALPGTARSLDVGDGVRVVSSGTLPAGLVADTTYYIYPGDDGRVKLCASVADSFAGTGINITSTGSGTHTLTYWDEARYKCNGTFLLDAEKSDIRDQLLTSCAGFAAEIGGTWFLHAGADAVPTLTLTEDDLRGSMVTTTRRSLRDRINGTRAVFVNPDNNWQPSDATPYRVPAFVTEDNGADLYHDMRYPFTLSARCVQRLQKIHVMRNRRQRTVQFPAKLSGMQLRLLDGLYLAIERYGWTQERHLVIGWALADDFGIDLTLQDDDGLTYTWDMAEEIDFAMPGSLTLPAPSSIAAPATITVTPPDSLVYSALTVAWAAVPSIWLDGYDLEYKAAGAADWIAWGRTVVLSEAVPVTAAADVRVRAVTRNGAVSDFTANNAPAIPTGVSATQTSSSEITVAWTAGAGAALTQIWHHGSDDPAAATLLNEDTASPFVHSGLAEGSAHYYWVRSKNSAGNVSNHTAQVNVVL